MIIFMALICFIHCSLSQKRNINKKLSEQPRCHSAWRCTSGTKRDCLSDCFHTHTHAHTHSNRCIHTHTQLKIIATIAMHYLRHSTVEFQNKCVNFCVRVCVCVFGLFMCKYMYSHIVSSDLQEARSKALLRNTHS